MCLCPCSQQTGSMMTRRRLWASSGHTPSYLGILDGQPFELPLATSQKKQGPVSQISDALLQAGLSEDLPCVWDCWLFAPPEESQRGYKSGRCPCTRPRFPWNSLQTTDSSFTPPPPLISSAHSSGSHTKLITFSALCPRNDSQPLTTTPATIQNKSWSFSMFHTSLFL